MATVQAKFGFPGIKLSGTPTDVQAGGQLLVFTTGGRRRYAVAGAGATRIAGVAMYDIPTTAAYQGGPTVGLENAQVAMVAVVTTVTASGAIAEGDKLIAAANGRVSAAGATPDARTIVGVAHEAAADGATFEARIF